MKAAKFKMVNNKKIVHCAAVGEEVEEDKEEETIPMLAAAVVLAE